MTGGPTPALPARSSAFREGALTIGASAAALLGNLATGVIAARALGADGRGELAAILTLAYMASWAFALGSPAVGAYFQAREPGNAPRLIGTWAVIVVPAGLVAVLAAQLVLPAVFAAQSDEAVDVARVFLCAVFVLVVGEFFFAFLLGAHRFTLYNGLRAGSPAALGVLYAALWAVDKLTVGSALIAFVAVNLVAVVGTAVHVIRRYGIGRPDARLARTTLSYGLRAHLTTLGEQVNARLDLLVLPAYLGATSVGLYSVATNVSWIIASVAGALRLIVLPKAARDEERAPSTVIRSAQATLALAVAGGAALALVAGPALEIVYGDAFGEAASALRILLPGCVLYAGAMVFASGLAALGRPLTAAAAQAVGLVITLVGLLVFLPGNGIETAAAISSAAYCVVFVAALVLYRRTARLPWTAFVRRSGTESA